MLAQGGAYLVQGTMDSDGHPITHTTRASPATVCILSTVLAILRVMRLHVFVALLRFSG